MARAFQELKYILQGANSTTGAGVLGKGVPMDVTDFRHLMLQIMSASSFNGTIKVQGSIAETCPDFTAAASTTNPWGYVQIKKLADASAVDGATGVVATGTDIALLAFVNTDGLKWLNVILTAYSAGSVDVACKPFNDAV